MFGAPLHESLRYASVQISTANASGELYVWGDIPVVVAKCGLYLKENGASSPRPIYTPTELGLTTTYYDCYCYCYCY